MIVVAKEIYLCCNLLSSSKKKHLEWPVFRAQIAVYDILKTTHPFPTPSRWLTFAGGNLRNTLAGNERKVYSYLSKFTLSLIFMDLFNATENCYHRTVKGSVLQCSKVYQTALFPRCFTVV